MSNILGSIHVIPGYSPVDTGAGHGEYFTDVVDAGECAEIEFLCNFGVITGDTYTFIVYSKANTTASGGTAIPFKYKLTSAIGTDVIGAWTACEATGYALSAGADGMVLRISVDPRDCTNALPYVFLGMNDTAGSGSAFVASVVILTVPRYMQSIPPTAVD